MEVLDKFDEGLLWPLLDFGWVNTSPPFLLTGDELANKFVSQVLETSDASRGRPLNHDCATLFKVAGK